MQDDQTPFSLHHWIMEDEKMSFKTTPSEEVEAHTPQRIIPHVPHCTKRVVFPGHLTPSKEVQNQRRIDGFLYEADDQQTYYSMILWSSSHRLTPMPDEIDEDE
jgi:hypothetical protein